MADTHVVAKRRTRIPRRVLAALAAVLLMATAACSGSSSSNGAVMHGPAKAAPDQAKRPGTTANRKAPLAADDRAVVHTADLTIRVPDVARAGDRAKADATGAGGYVADENTTHTGTDGSRDTSTLVLRVPVARYPATLDLLHRDVGRPLSQHQSSEDKTGEVADVSSRITSAQASLKRLRKIMDKATSVSDIMDVEGAISTRESDLESLQAQAKALDRQTTYSTITLNLVGPQTVVHKKKAAAPGFVDGLEGGWHALLTFLRVAVMVIGAVLPFAALVAVFAVPGWWFWRRRRTKQEAAPAD